MSGLTAGFYSCSKSFSLMSFSLPEKMFYRLKMSYHIKKASFYESFNIMAHRSVHMN